MTLPTFMNKADMNVVIMCEEGFVVWVQCLSQMSKPQLDLRKLTFFFSGQKTMNTSENQ